MHRIPPIFGGVLCRSARSVSQGTPRPGVRDKSPIEFWRIEGRMRQTGVPSPAEATIHNPFTTSDCKSPGPPIKAYKRGRRQGILWTANGAIRTRRPRLPPFQPSQPPYIGADRKLISGTPSLRVHSVSSTLTPKPSDPSVISTDSPLCPWTSCSNAEAAGDEVLSRAVADS